MSIIDGAPHRLPVHTRADLERFAVELVGSALRHASPGGARIDLPGPQGANSAGIAGLEGFARSFLIAGFLLAGRDGADPDGFAEKYGQGLAAGVDPSSPERWPLLTEHPQAKVEAASIALILDMTRPWLWERLGSQTQQHVIAYLSPAVGDDTYPRINWVWFRLVVQTFLRSVGGPFSEEEMRADLATHDTFVRPGGWLADGSQRAYDHYAGWALHLYPTLWARMQGAQDLAHERWAEDRDRLDLYLHDAVRLVGADGSPLLQGRSLIYRFAAAAPFWIGAMAKAPSHDPGLLRAAAMRIVSHFVEQGVPDADGVLTQGWHHAWPTLSQAYSGPGSPYWAAKGLLGLALPESDPVWTSSEQPLPIDERDVLSLVQAPGWIISGTKDDGVVRVYNHGTDHATEGSWIGDSPLYARIGYSTATSPLLDDSSWRSPAEQSVSLLDSDGRATHRSGFTTGPLRTLDAAGMRVGIGSSSTVAHWLEPQAVQQHHGYGYEGESVHAGTVESVSVVRGAWEIRCVRIGRLTPEGAERATTLRVTGWAVPAGEAHADHHGATVAGARLDSVVATQAAGAMGAVLVRDDATPLSRSSAIPHVDLPLDRGVWSAVVIGLGAGLAEPPQASIEADALAVTWADASVTIDLSEFR